MPPFSSPRLRVRDIVKAQSLFRSILLKSSRQIPSSQSVRPLNPCAAMYAFRRSRSDFSHPQCLQFSVGEQTAFPRPSRQVKLMPFIFHPRHRMFRHCFAHSCSSLNLLFVTAIGYGSTSLAQSGLIPFIAPARGKPPLPSNRLPNVFAPCSAMP